jgi:hypothetical protein
MKKVLLALTVLISVLLISKQSNAQNSDNTTSYQTAVGLKFGGYENGVSVKYFATSDVSYEGVLGFRDHGVVVTGLYEINQEAFSEPALKFYCGFGAHLGAIGKGNYDRFGGNDEYYNSSHILLGADGVLGLEYMIPQSPIAVSLDLDPRVELATGPFFDIAPGLGIKYTF